MGGTGDGPGVEEAGGGVAPVSPVEGVRDLVATGIGAGCGVAVLRAGDAGSRSGGGEGDLRDRQIVVAEVDAGDAAIRDIDYVIAEPRRVGLSPIGLVDLAHSIGAAGQIVELICAVGISGGVDARSVRPGQSDGPAGQACFAWVAGGIGIGVVELGSGNTRVVCYGDVDRIRPF